MRIRFSYERLILDRGLLKEFHYYCRKHPAIKSKRRLARNFLLSKGFRREDFIVATKCDFALEEAICICKMNWLVD